MSDPFVVLGDYLREFMPEDDASLLLRWAQNMDAARHLMVFHPVKGDDDNHICADCSARVYSLNNESHRKDCSILRAWSTLGDPRWYLNLERCEDEARSLNEYLGSSALQRLELGPNGRGTLFVGDAAFLVVREPE